jgi:hypothetical protein
MNDNVKLKMVKIQCLLFVFLSLSLSVTAFTTHKVLHSFITKSGLDYRHKKLTLRRPGSAINSKDNGEEQHLGGDDDDGQESAAKNEAELLRSKAEQLREQIRAMEEQLPRSSISNNNDEYIQIESDDASSVLEEGKSLKNKRVLVVGANGRLGSMVTRYLLRNHPEVKEVVAAVHYVGEATTRGYGRLSYEVGAEDGVGTIGAAWAPEEERNASFEFSDAMKDYNLQNLVCAFFHFSYF